MKLQTLFVALGLTFVAGPVLAKQLIITIDEAALVRPTDATVLVGTIDSVRVAGDKLILTSDVADCTILAESKAEALAAYTALATTDRILCQADTKRLKQYETTRNYTAKNYFLEQGPVSAWLFMVIKGKNHTELFEIKDGKYVSLKNTNQK